MKKKLLSLVLAGAMVASTSVSAFAADTAKHTETSIEAGKDEQEVPVEITGNVLDDKGNVKPGTINVTVPTSTTFSVTKTGELISPNMNITNNSQEKIKVIASRFEDPNGTDKINIVKKSDFGDNVADNERGKIWLRLKGGSKNFGLASDGKIYKSDYSSEEADEANRVVDEVAAGRTLTLTLEGAGGTTAGATTPADKAIQDDFKLVLKIKRA